MGGLEGGYRVFEVVESRDGHHRASEHRGAPGLCQLFEERALAHRRAEVEAVEAGFWCYGTCNLSGDCQPAAGFWADNGKGQGPGFGRLSALAAHEFPQF